MKTKNNRFLIVILVITFVIIFIRPSKVNAALQSNGGAPAGKALINWLVEIRKMQSLGGTLGRTDSINESTLLSNATDLDIHMEKNTEYGAMAILSASSYGNPNKIQSGQTTTGNQTGIKINLNNEWVALGDIEEYGVPAVWKSAKSRYRERYIYGTSTGNDYIKRIGDAITETSGWHGSTKSTWLSVNSQQAGLLRSCSGSIFSYDAAGGTSHGSPWGSYYKSSYASRAVIVVGSGL